MKAIGVEKASANCISAGGGAISSRKRDGEINKLIITSSVRLSTSLSLNKAFGNVAVASSHKPVLIFIILFLPGWICFLAAVALLAIAI